MKAPLPLLLLGFSPVVAAAMLTPLVSAMPADELGAKAVVELFTSQGCSSCPPADRVLDSLAHHPDMIAVSFPVDYWDYIGWKDTLASPGFTARQKGYAQTRGDGHVYTPQIVVDGRADVVGSDREQVDHAIDTNKGRDGALSVPIHLTDQNGVLHVKIGAGGAGLPEGKANVYVLRVVRNRTVTIERGENKGRKLTYTNVVRALSKIGEWHGAPLDLELMEVKGDDEGYVVFLQQGTPDAPGTILAAAKTAGF